MFTNAVQLKGCNIHRCLAHLFTHHVLCGVDQGFHIKQVPQELSKAAAITKTAGGCWWRMILAIWDEQFGMETWNFDKFWWILEQFGMEISQTNSQPPTQNLRLRPIRRKIQHAGLEGCQKATKQFLLFNSLLLAETWTKKHIPLLCHHLPDDKNCQEMQSKSQPFLWGKQFDCPIGTSEFAHLWGVLVDLYSCQKIEVPTRDHLSKAVEISWKNWAIFGLCRSHRIPQLGLRTALAPLPPGCFQSAFLSRLPEEKSDNDYVMMNQTLIILDDHIIQIRYHLVMVGVYISDCQPLVLRGQAGCMPKWPVVNVVAMIKGDLLNFSVPHGKYQVKMWSSKSFPPNKWRSHDGTCFHNCIGRLKLPCFLDSKKIRL